METRAQSEPASPPEPVHCSNNINTIDMLDIDSPVTTPAPMESKHKDDPVVNQHSNSSSTSRTCTVSPYFNFLLYCGGHMIVGSLSSASAAVAPMLEEQLNIDETTVSLIYTFCWVGHGIGCFMSGIIVDLVKKSHYYIGILFLVTSVLILTMHYVNSVFVMILYWIWFGITMGSCETAFAVYIFAIFGESGTKMATLLYLPYTSSMVSMPLLYMFEFWWNILASVAFVVSVSFLLVVPTPELPQRRKKNLQKKGTQEERIDIGGVGGGGGDSVTSVSFESDIMADFGTEVFSSKVDSIYEYFEFNAFDVFGMGSPSARCEAAMNNNSKLINVFTGFTVISSFSIYFGNRISIAFISVYYNNVLNLANGTIIADTLLSTFYFGFLAICMVGSFIYARIKLIKILMLCSIMILFGIVYLAIAQEYSLLQNDKNNNNSNNSADLYFLILYISYFIRGFFELMHFQVTLGILGNVRIVTGFISMITFLNFSLALACSGYVAGFILNIVGYNWIPHLSIMIIAFQITVVIVLAMLLRSIEPHH